MAIITDINEYRASKGHPAGTVLQNKRLWPDTRLQSRHTVLRHIEAGNLDPFDRRSTAVQTGFPNGYDPERNVEDNLRLIEAEAARRGVTLTSP